MSTKVKKPLSPARYLFFLFLAAILAGSLLLALPVSHRTGVVISYTDALFTAVSAVCVTGLTTVDVSATFSPFGAAVIALLIMVGGMGVAGMIVATALFLGFKVGLGQRNIVSESYNIGSLKGIFSVIRAVVISSLLFQGAGAILYYQSFSETMESLPALGYSMFHAVSAFNNAGFDLLGNFESLAGFSDNTYFILVTSTLIIAGGLGFFVISDTFINRFRWRSLSMHSKMVYSFTLFLLLSGTVFFLFSGELSLLDSWFLSVTSRTAGFSTLSLGSLKNVQVLFLMSLMFIGASPGSTGGGIKTTTMLTILLSLFPVRKRKDVVIFSRAIDRESVQKAYQVLALGLFTVVACSMVLMGSEGDVFASSDLVFEAVSAFATVGLSSGVTPELSALSKAALMVTMFIGRVGPITIASTLLIKESRLGFIRERVFIG